MPTTDLADEAGEGPGPTLRGEGRGGRKNACMYRGNLKPCILYTLVPLIVNLCTRTVYICTRAGGSSSSAHFCARSYYTCTCTLTDNYHAVSPYLAEGGQVGVAYPGGQGGQGGVAHQGADLLQTKGKRQRIYM